MILHSALRSSVFVSVLLQAKEVQKSLRNSSIPFYPGKHSSPSPPPVWVLRALPAQAERTGMQEGSGIPSAGVTTTSAMQPVLPAPPGASECASSQVPAPAAVPVAAAWADRPLWLPAFPQTCPGHTDALSSTKVHLLQWLPPAPMHQLLLHHLKSSNVQRQTVFADPGDKVYMLKVTKSFETSSQHGFFVVFFFMRSQYLAKQIDKFTLCILWTMNEAKLNSCSNSML